MIFEVKKPCGPWNEGDTISDDDINKAGHSAERLVRRECLHPIGFQSFGQPRTEVEQANMVGNLQAKIEALEADRDKLREELKTAEKRVKVLEEGHRTGSEQLRDSIATITNQAAELRKHKEDRAREEKTREEVAREERAKTEGK